MLQDKQLSENERRYLEHVISMVNVILWEMTASPDYLERGSFRDQDGELMFRVALFWLVNQPADERIARLRHMCDAVKRVMTDASPQSDSPVLRDTVQFLSNLNTSVSNIYRA